MKGHRLILCRLLQDTVIQIIRIPCASEIIHGTLRIAAIAGDIDTVGLIFIGHVVKDSPDIFFVFNEEPVGVFVELLHRIDDRSLCDTSVFIGLYLRDLLIILDIKEALSSANVTFYRPDFDDHFLPPLSLFSSFQNS